MRDNLFDVSQKVVVISGGAGVLGSNMAKYLLSVGAKIALLDLNQEQINIKIEELKQVGSDVIGYAGSVLSETDMQEAKSQIMDKWGKVDALINAAGGNMPGATIGEDQTIFDLKMEDFRKVSQLNLDGSVIPSLVFGELMSQNGKGCIINISSMTATQAVTRVVGYSVSKAAIDNFTRWMATELALKFGDGLRVNAIAPGFFIGNQNRRLLTNEDGSYTQRGNTIISNTPMKRFGEADELNGTIHWLISDAASFVTGVIVPIDGGFSAFSGV
ncbi:SDR family oxidoreductase [Flagellimonas nanhaiensis]|uniref:SDR family NAD(P)-dependent oxidoreductase n=1 Tax=Flagellimonas nanhaiensis TaxID=2292706 RepID=A0A371JP78_9FLAO|nr:SDR family oxidoreductase [Allomuricauda nanhaiensis]RDY59307.1 SDR family NAD(P)-dependent oxidoreductase [Allomuricauda nanhaiensis]